MEITGRPPANRSGDGSDNAAAVSDKSLHVQDVGVQSFKSPRGPLETTSGDDEYEYVAASATAQQLGATGAAGDYLKTLIVCVTTSGATGLCTLNDGGGSEMNIVPASSPIGTYIVRLGIRSITGSWRVTTGAACTALAIGDFT